MHCIRSQSIIDYILYVLFVLVGIVWFMFYNKNELR